MAMELIETIEVGAGGVTSIEFTSIPQDGTDLVILLSGKSSRAQVSGDFYFRMNGATSGYSWKDLMAYATTVYSQTGATATEIDPSLYGIPGSVSATTNIWSNTSIYFSNYTSSTNKSVSVDASYAQNALSRSLGFLAGSLTTTSPITSIELFNRSGETYVQYSTASLFKIY